MIVATRVRATALEWRILIWRLMWKAATAAVRLPGPAPPSREGGDMSVRGDHSVLECPRKSRQEQDKNTRRTSRPCHPPPPPPPNPPLRPPPPLPFQAPPTTPP